MNDIRRFFLRGSAACLCAVMLIAAGTGAAAVGENDTADTFAESSKEAEQAFVEYGDFRFLPYGGEGLSLTEYTGNSEEVEIPAEVNGVPVMYISADAFAKNSGSESAGENETIKKIILGKYVRGFENKQRTSADNKYSIMSDPFISCRSLEAIEVSADNNDYCSVDGILYSKDKKVLYQCPPGKTGTVSVAQGTQKIAEGSFQYSSAEKAELPENLVSVGKNAFFHADSLKSIVIPSGTRIIEAAFYSCTSLERVIICSGVEDVGSNAFGGCTALREIVVPASVRSGDFLLNIPDADISAEPQGEITMYGEAGSHTQSLFSDKSYIRFVPMTAEELKAMETPAEDDEKKSHDDIKENKADSSEKTDQKNQSNTDSGKTAEDADKPGAAADDNKAQTKSEEKNSDTTETADEGTADTPDTADTDDAYTAYENSGKNKERSVLSPEEKSRRAKLKAAREEDFIVPAIIIATVIIVAVILLIGLIPSGKKKIDEDHDDEEMNENIDDDSEK